MNHPVKIKYVAVLAAAWLAWIAWSDHRDLQVAISHIQQLHDVLQMTMGR